MMHNLIRILFLYILIIHPTYSVSAQTCDLLFDAGSSGTRLYAYKKIGSKLEQVYSDRIKVGISWALEDKNCGTRKCTLIDITESIKTLLKNLMINKSCSEGIKSIKLYSTAGMRLAEQKAGYEKTKNTYNQIKKTILDVVNKNKTNFKTLQTELIEARTLSGQEEGIYTWITVNSINDNKIDYSDILEMGGASVQLTYVCKEDDKECKRHGIKISTNNLDEVLYSYSWLGIGRNEAFESANNLSGSPCNSPNDSPNGSLYEKSLCEANIKHYLTISKDGNVYINDPLNYKDGVKGTNNQVRSLVSKKMHLTGGFGYEKLNNLELNAQNICGLSVEELKDSIRFPNLKYTSESLLRSQCFALKYYYKIMTVFDIQEYSNKQKINGTSIGWTYGAAICALTNCLDRKQLKCRWRKDLSCD